MKSIPVFRVARDGSFRRLQRVRQESAESQVVASSHDIRGVVRSWSAERANEAAFAIYLDRHNRMLGISTLATGDHASVTLSARLVLVPALLLAECTAVITGHNHMTDPAMPSEDDVAAFRRLRTNLDGIVEYLDNTIISPGDFFSFRDAGYFRERAAENASYAPREDVPPLPTGDALPRRIALSFGVNPLVRDPRR